MQKPYLENLDEKPKRLPFCDHHIAAFLNGFAGGSQPLDQALGDYLRAHKSIGAHDRRAISETLFGMIRWKPLIEYFCPSPLPIDQLAAFRSLSLENCFNNPSIPAHIRFGISQFLYQRFCKAFGAEKTRDLCRILNGPAPIAIRANLAKITRDDLLPRLKERFQDQIQEFSVFPCSLAPAGIQFDKRVPLFSITEFKEGLFEMQDEGSQLVAALVDVKPGDQVLDYCSGSGGKTLAFAPAMKGKGQIYLHDIRPSILLEAKKRLKRAGIQNGQFLPPGHPHLPFLKGKMDWVLADVPCSGTGVLRRNPDAKWKIDEAMMQRLIEEQRKIVAETIPYLKKEGRLVYATCSLLPEENQEQVDYFLAHHDLVLEKPPLSLLPQEGGADGFFAAVFRKKESCYDLPTTP